MNCLEDYINYLKDNPEGYWFKRKLYGYGWTPARKEGWFTLVIYLVVVLGTIIYAEANILPTTDVITIVLVATAAFLVICWKKGESLKWQWGKEKTRD